MKLKLAGLLCCLSSFIGAMNIASLPIGDFLQQARDNKKTLDTQVKQLKDVCGTFITTGQTLSEKLGQIDTIMQQVEDLQEQLHVPRQITVDPLALLSDEIKKGDQFLQSVFDQILRTPELQKLYVDIFTATAGAVGFSSALVLLDKLDRFLALVQQELQAFKKDFQPAVKEFEVPTANIAALKDVKKITYDQLAQNYDAIKQQHPSFDPSGIYAGVISAVKDFTLTGTELENLAVYLEKVKKLQERLKR